MLKKKVPPSGHIAISASTILAPSPAIESSTSSTKKPLTRAKNVTLNLLGAARTALSILLTGLEMFAKAKPQLKSSKS